MASTREDTSLPALENPQSSTGVDAAYYQHLLLNALENGQIGDVRGALSRIPEAFREPTLLARSKYPEHKLRTPLMAAAATGDMAIFGALLGAFDDLFRRDGDIRQLGGNRKVEMAWQLEAVDDANMTLLMHAAASGTSAVFTAVAQEICPHQMRRMLPRQDENRMNFLMHAVSAKSDHLGVGATPTKEEQKRSTEEALSTDPPPPPYQEAPTPPQQVPVEQPELPVPSPATDDDEHKMSAVGLDAVVLDPLVPVVVNVLEFAHENLWLPEYRKLLETRDAWNRSIIEHSIVSGRQQVFEAVFNAVRNDIHDDKIAFMLDTGIESSYAQNSMRTALQSPGGHKVSLLVAEKTKALQRDVSIRAEASTVGSKIQAFIPANLIVIFQLLLPELEGASSENAPLIGLLALCAIAPFWAWGASMTSSKDPDIKNTRARETSAKFFLAIPAMFFWGVGTSEIGPTSLGWHETVSAASLAVATIVIPALDLFFSGRGARATVSVIIIAMLDLWEWLEEKWPYCRRPKHVRQYQEADDSWGREEQHPPTARRTTRDVRTSPLVRDISPPPEVEDMQAPTGDVLEAGRTNAAPVHDSLVGFPPSQDGSSRLPQSPTASIWEE